MRQFSVSFVVWAKSQDSVHKPQFLKTKENRRGSNRGPSAYQPSALPLGHTGSQFLLLQTDSFYRWGTVVAQVRLPSAEHPVGYRVCRN